MESQNCYGELGNNIFFPRIQNFNEYKLRLYSDILLFVGILPNSNLYTKNAVLCMKYCTLSSIFSFMVERNILN